jgi:hypothetical protein
MGACVCTSHPLHGPCSAHFIIFLLITLRVHKFWSCKFLFLLSLSCTSILFLNILFSLRMENQVSEPSRSQKIVILSALKLDVKITRLWTKCEHAIYKFDLLLIPLWTSFQFVISQLPETLPHFQRIYQYFWYYDFFMCILVIRYEHPLSFLGFVF